MSAHEERTTLSGRLPETLGSPAPAPIDPNTGMHKDYWILSENERSKGFVRPVRQTYVHVGRPCCGKEKSEMGMAPPVGTVAYVCSMEPGHEGECYVFSPVDAEGLDRVRKRGLLGGCDMTTSMNIKIAETYARDPKFYGSTYCATCMTHQRVEEFTWKGTSETVGS